MLNRTRLIIALLLVAVAATAVAKPMKVPGLKSSVKVIRDIDGIPHIIASNEHDLLFVQGYLHAQDRFFQMDVSRRRGSGTLAELLGQPALGSDVELRTFGLRRAAELSLSALSPETQAGLQAYADGVNFFLATQALPPEYGVLEIKQAEPWTPLDSVVIGKLIAFGLSFDLDVSLTQALVSYQIAGGMLGFDGTALFFEDLFRTQPFDPAATIPDALAAAAMRTTSQIQISANASKLASSAEKSVAVNASTKQLDPAIVSLVKDYIARVQGIPVLKNALEARNKPQGSNEWAVAPSHSARADDSDDFMFGSGPSRRYAGEASRAPRGISGRTVLPGGQSGVLGSPLYANILGRWLTNDSYDIRQRNNDVEHSAASTQKFVPGKVE